MAEAGIKEELYFWKNVTELEENHLPAMCQAWCDRAVEFGEKAYRRGGFWIHKECLDNLKKKK